MPGGEGSFVAGSFMQGGEGAFDLGQEEGDLIGRKDGGMERQDGFQEACSWGTGRRWEDGSSEW